MNAKLWVITSTIKIVSRYFTAIKIVSRYFRDKLEKMSFIDFVVCVFPGLRDQVAHGTSKSSFWIPAYCLNRIRIQICSKIVLGRGGGWHSRRRFLNMIFNIFSSNPLGLPTPCLPTRSFFCLYMSLYMFTYIGCYTESCRNTHNISL